ncbi:MAG: long-chain fatty acid--CoA ligase [Acidobacteriota bacterium]
MNEVSESTIRTARTTARGTPLLADEPATLGGLFLQAAAKYGRADALNFKSGGEWRHISSAEMIERAGNIALGLYAIGLRTGDKAAILASNSPLWTLADAGCQLAGVVDVPLYTTLAPKTISFILNNSGTKALFIQDRASYERIAEIVPECPALEKIIFFDDAGRGIANAVSIAEFETSGAELRKQRPELFDEISRAAQPADIATLIYTSGTTGEPKGVMLTHANIVSNVIDSGEKYTFSSADVPLSVLPLSHIFERSAMYLYILNGMAVHYAESVDRAPDNLREVRPTIFVGVPRIFEKVYSKAKLKAAQAGGVKEKVFDWAIDTAREFALHNAEKRPIPMPLMLKHFIADRLVYTQLRDFFGGRLRSCICGGAALPDDIYLIFTGAGIPIMQGYGLTETSPVISSNNAIDAKLGSVGKPIRNFKVRIASDGEIEAHGPGVMLGYYNNAAATHDAFTDDGWFRTGDIGHLDDGFLVITDRKKELFKTSGGKYIAPSPIEQMIRSSRFVSQAVLVGNGRKFAAALIVPNFEMLESYAKHKGFAHLETPEQFCHSPQILDLIERQVAHATEGLARFETVKKIALLENELTVDGGELTPTLKVKRRVVDEKYRDVIDNMYRERE